MQGGGRCYLDLSSGLCLGSIVYVRALCLNVNYFTLITFSNDDDHNEDDADDAGQLH